MSECAVTGKDAGAGSLLAGLAEAGLRNKSKWTLPRLFFTSIFLVFLAENIMLVSLYDIFLHNSMCLFFANQKICFQLYASFLLH